MFVVFCRRLTFPITRCQWWHICQPIRLWVNWIWTVSFKKYLHTHIHVKFLSRPLPHCIPFLTCARTDNCFSEIGGLLHCASLTHLSLAHNKISCISGLDKLPIKDLCLVGPNSSSCLLNYSISNTFHVCYIWRCYFTWIITLRVCLLNHLILRDNILPCVMLINEYAHPVE